MNVLSINFLLNPKSFQNAETRHWILEKPERIRKICISMKREIYIRSMITLQGTIILEISNSTTDSHQIWVKVSSSSRSALSNLDTKQLPSHLQWGGYSLERSFLMPWDLCPLLLGKEEVELFHPQMKHTEAEMPLI